VREAPSPLQEQFAEQLAGLAASEQARIQETLERVVSMMGGDGIEAAPVLSTSPAAQSRAEMRDVLEVGDTDVSVVAEMAPEVAVASSLDESK